MSRVTTQLVIEGKNTTKRAFDEVNGDLSSLSSMATKAGAALAGALSVGVFAAWIKESALATAQMGRMAELSGATAEEFQRWSYASRTVGIEQDKLGDIFKDVQDKIGDFLQTGGGPMADFFENIAPKVGVTAEQFRNLSGPAAMQLYVKSLEEANLSQSEMTFYMEAIANDATLLLPLLRDGGRGFSELAAEAEKLGLVLSGQDAANAREFERGLQTLGAVSEGAGKQISAELLPTLNVLNGLLVDTSKNGGYTAQIANLLGFVMKVLATGAIIAGNAFGSLGRFIGGAAAAAVQVATGNFAAAADIMRAVGEDNARETGLAVETISGLWNGALEEAGKTATSVAAEWKASQDSMSQAAELNAATVKEAYKGIAEEAKKRIKEVSDAERAATSEVERLRKERLDIEKRYSDASAQLQGVGSGSASFGSLQALQAGARQALQAGNLEQAQSQAQAALKVLMELQAAGENTYGFQGIANELQGIEEQANRLQQTEADKALAAITAELEALKRSADIKITVGMSIEEVAKATQQIRALAAQLGKEFVITPTIAAPSGLDFTQPYTLVDPGPAPTGFATGGAVRGPGTGTSDSIMARLSNGEYVLKAAAVRQYGTALLDRMNGLQMPAFADGGLVEAAMSAPAASPGRDLGRVALDIGGQQYEFLADPNNFQKVLRTTAAKVGASKPRRR